MLISSISYSYQYSCGGNCFCDVKYHILQDVVLQEAALKLQVLTSEEFDSLVVPEKMIGPSN